MSGEPWIQFPPSWAPAEIAHWLVRWMPPDVHLHIPYTWRDQLSPDEWVQAVGHFPTFSCLGDGFARDLHTGEALHMVQPEKR